jgi:predicted phosphodiesterase
MHIKGFIIIILILRGLSGFCQHLIHSEMLSRPANTSILISSFFDSPVECRVKYGIESENYDKVTSWALSETDSVNEAASDIILNGLLPGTRYYYRLEYRAPHHDQIVTRPEYTFHTAREKGQSFMFTVQADPHLDASSDTALYRRCLLNQKEDEPDFMIELGDFIMSDKLKNVNHLVPKDTIPFRCKLLRSYYEVVCHSSPLMIVLGNHEGEAGWYLNNHQDNIANWNTIYRKKYFHNPIPDNFYTGDTTSFSYVGLREAYYAWTWGDALFIVLDPYWNTSPKPDSLHGWRWTLGKQQYDWLKSTLENSDAMFKFVFCHHLVGGGADGRGGVEWSDFYEWGGKNLDGTEGWGANRPGWEKPIKQILEQNEVNIFFHGHDHLYASQGSECLVYQEVPQPSLPIFQGVPQAQEYGYTKGIILPNSGHIRVTVKPQEILTEYVRAFLPAHETAQHHNKDVDASYRIGNINCYDSVSNVSQWGKDIQIGKLTAYPNPTSGYVKIGFEPIPDSTEYVLQISTLLGTIVRTLNGSRRQSDSGVLAIWDGKDESGIMVNAGMYLCSTTIQGKKYVAKIQRLPNIY